MSHHEGRTRTAAVVYSNPRAPSDELAEELVRMLVRVRRHLGTRRVTRRR